LPTTSVYPFHYPLPIASVYPLPHSLPIASVLSANPFPNPLLAKSVASPTW